MESIQKGLLLKNELYCILLGTVLLSLIIPFHVDFRLGKKMTIIMLYTSC